MCRFFCKDVYIFTPIFLNGVKRHVEYDKLRFQPKIICNAVCEDYFAKMYLFLPLFYENGVMRHVVEHDKLRFQQEIICNALCEVVFLQKCILIFTPIFLKWCQKTC